MKRDASQSPSVDRLAPSKRPSQRAVGSQRWQDLFFLHWTVPAEVIRPSVPRELELDLYEGQAWLGIVPFKMRDVRPAGLPVVPFVSNFLETNVRTYVHYRGEPGVWFVSLDANAIIATLVARYRWNLNYCKGNLQYTQAENTIQCNGKRTWPAKAECNYQIETEFPSAANEVFHAEPGSFEHFLVERYLLFTQNKRGEILRGQVHHQPYGIQNVGRCTYQGNLEQQVGLDQLKMNPDHVLFSPGVSVEMFALAAVV